MSLMALDPGIRGCGVAMFDLVTGRMNEALYIKNPITSGNRPEHAWQMALAIQREMDIPHELVFEYPQIYTRGKSKGNPNTSLIPLAFVDGMVVGLLKPIFVRAYLPSEWKAQVKKEVHHERIKKYLTEDEMQRFYMPSAAKTLAHNVWDAVALGLFAVGRVGIGGTAPKKVVKK